jgi:predicted dehydrogenase
VEGDLQAALAQHPEAVIISNPTALHLDIAIPAARAGCHLFLEKPISHSLERVDELQAAVQHSGCQVFVGYQFRFHPGLCHARRLLVDGTIGRPLSVRAHWGEYLPGWHPWEDYRQGYSARADLGGGVLLTLNHPLDYLRWLFGEVSALWAFAGQLSDLELKVEDTAEIGLRFASDVLGSLHLDYNQRPPSHRLEVIGTQGTIRWDNADGATHVQQASDEGWQTYPPPQGFERNHLFLEQMRHFQEVVQGRAEPICSLEDGVKALQLSLAAHASQDQGQIIYIASQKLL